MEVAASRPAVVRGAPGLWRWVVTAVLVIAVIVLGFALYSPASRALGASDDTSRRDSVLQSARQVALNMVTMNYNTVNTDVERVMSGATGSFKDQWGSQSKALIEAVTKNQSKSQGSVVSAGVVSIDDDSAEVIVAVTSVVTTPEVPSGATRNQRFRMDLVKQDGKWLVSTFGLVS